jgi:hypothetical protein
MFLRRMNQTVVYNVCEENRRLARERERGREIRLNNILKKSVPTLQKGCYFSVTSTGRLMLFGLIIAVYFENFTKHINTCPCASKIEKL